MKKLLIDEELRDLLPPLSIDEKEQLEKNLVKNGYVGSPIYTWNGYIVDGHNRYEICKKHNIDFTSEELFRKGEFTKIDVMEWMINTQLGRRNLIPAQRILIAKKFKEKIMEEARQKYKETVGRPSKNNHSPKGEQLSISKKIHTEKELAKLVGVGSGTIARFDQVMKHGDEEIKQKVISGEMRITPAYDLIKERKDDDKKKDEEEQKKEDVVTNDVKQNRDDNSIKDIIADMKLPKYADDYWNFLNEIECIEENFQEPIDVAFDILFERHDINGRITLEERDIAVNCISDIIKQIENLKIKIMKSKLKGEM